MILFTMSRLRLSISYWRRLKSDHREMYRYSCCGSINARSSSSSSVGSMECKRWRSLVQLLPWSAWHGQSRACWSLARWWICQLSCNRCIHHGLIWDCRYGVIRSHCIGMPSHPRHPLDYYIKKLQRRYIRSFRANHVDASREFDCRRHCVPLS